MASAAPAAAATRLVVEAGWGGGSFVAGRPLPVRVDITADRLVTGSLRVSLGGEQSTTVAVEVPGGSTKRVVVVLATSVDGGPGGGRVQATLTGDERAEGTTDVTAVTDTELVGLLPGLAAQAPRETPLAVDVGTARFDLLEEIDLATPGALGGLGTIVAADDGLRALRAPGRANVLAWVADGGALVVDVPTGTAVDGVPAAWQPGDGRRIAAGRGEVRLSGGAAVAGRWGEVVEPTPLTNTFELSGGGGNWFAAETVADSVAHDGGLRVPEVGWLAAFLVVYLVIAGPVAFLVLRRMGRSGWTWAAVPAVAVLFTAAAFVVGGELRTGSRAAHASLVETGPAGSRVTTQVGLVSRNGSDGTAVFPDGWIASAYEGNPMAGDWNGGGGPRTDLTSDGLRPVARIALEAGGFGVVSGSGPLAGVDGAAGSGALEGLEVSATAAADGSLSGTVRNGTDIDLDEAIVLVGRRTVGLGGLAAGAEREWQLGPGEGRPNDVWGPVETPWLSASGWDGPPDAGSPINFAFWNDLVMRRTDAYAPGQVIVAGWTEAWAPPVDVGGPLEG
ncbi:MAG: hypothetical protein ACRDZN_13230, partial [Acidimicrobiales bacterium]